MTSDMRRDLTLGEMLGGLVFVVSGSRIVWVRTPPRGTYRSWSYSISDLRRYFAGNVTYWPVGSHQPRSTFNLWLDHKERLTVANRNDLQAASLWVNGWHRHAADPETICCPGPWPYL